MNKTKILLIAVILLSTAGFAHAKEGNSHEEPGHDKLGIDLSLNYASKYIWYGFDEYGNDSAVHPKLEIDLGKGFTAELGYWSSTVGGHVNHNELEYGLAYGNHIGHGKETIHYHAHWIYYDYPKVNSKELDKQEFAVGFSLPHIFPVGNTEIEPYYDAVWVWPAKSSSHVKEIGGYLHRFGLKCDLPVSGLVEEKDQVFSFFADVTYNGNMGLYHHTEATDYDWSHATFGVSTDIKVGDLTFTPYLNYQHSMEDRVNDENELYGGITVAYHF